MNKKTDEERKAEKEDRERKKTSVKAIDVAIGVTNPVNRRGKMARVNVKSCRYNRAVPYFVISVSYYTNINMAKREISLIPRKVETRNFNGKLQSRYNRERLTDNRSFYSYFRRDNATYRAL